MDHFACQTRVYELSTIVQIIITLIKCKSMKSGFRTGYTWQKGKANKSNIYVLKDSSKLFCVDFSNIFLYTNSKRFFSGSPFIYNNLGFSQDY